jgi:tetratricopeptide (TPR) repeat protein
LKYIDPQTNPALDRFMTPEKMTRLDAEESYIRGLLSTDKEQQHKWLLQAANLDARFVGPAFELGRVYWEKKDYRQSIKWLQRVPAPDVRYPEARFRMGLDAYSAGDYNAAANYFREVANLMPLSEVYNNLAAAEEQLNQPAAIDDYRHALDGDPNDVTYIFNLGSALLRKNDFEEAAKKLEIVISHTPDDGEAEDLLARAHDREVNPPGTQPLAPIRLKSNFDATAFRQLKAMLQPKGKG